MNVLYNGRLGSLLTLKLSTMQSKGIVLFPCELHDSLQCHIVNLCTILSPQSNFDCCNTPSSEWQRQWLKQLLFKCTILTVLVIASYAKCMHRVQMNVLYNGRLGSLLTMQSKGIVLFPCEMQDSLQCHIVNLCTILSPQSNFDCCNTPSSRWQRQW